MAMESGILKQEITFRYIFSDEGFYIYNLYFPDSVYLYIALSDQGQWCHYHYHYADRYLNLYSISFNMFPFILATYGK